MVMKFTNNAATTLATGITNSATSLTVSAGAGALFPTSSGSDYFYCTLANSNGAIEIIKVTTRSTDTFTIVRGQDGTSGQAWNSGDKVELRLVAASLNDLPKLDETNTFSSNNTFTTSVTTPIVTSAAATALTLKSAGTTALTIDTSQNATFVGTATATKLIPTGTSVTGNGLYLPAANSLGLSTNGTNAVYIDSSQNVGIGTSSPSNTLHVVGSQLLTSASAETKFNINNTGTGGLNWWIGSTNNSSGAVGGGRLVFYDQTSNAARMVIDSSGNLLVGQTTSNNARLQVTQTTTATESATFTNSSASPYGLGVTFSGADPNNATNYVFAAYNSFASVFMYRIYSNGTVAARSDARWKKNIETARNGYAEDLSRLRVVKYNWYNQDDGAPKELGLIAQEVEQVFPNLVQTDPVMKKREVTDEQGNVTEEEYQDGDSKSIKVSVLTPMLIKAIQEQQALIVSMRNELDALKTKVGA